MKKRKVNLVKRVNVGGLDIQVLYVSKFPKKIIDELGGNCVAYCDWANRVIVIRNDVAKVDDLTLVHEIMHAAIESISDNQSYQKEWFVKSVSQILYGALKSMGRPLR